VYWSDEGVQRTDLLERVVAYLAEHRWGQTVDSGWSNWDVEIYCHPWTVVQVCTAQEDHGGNKHLIRVRSRLRPSGSSKVLAMIGLCAFGVVVLSQVWQFALVVGLVFAMLALLWWRGARRATQALAVFDAVADQLGLIRCSPDSGRPSERGNLPSGESR
jgi:hypothetical protein